MRNRLLVLALVSILVGSSLWGSPGLGRVFAASPEAGFQTIEPITLYFHYGSVPNRLQLTSSEARIWYSFRPADVDPGHKPLFVFYNGGPGSATSSGLMSMNTGPYTLDNTIETGGGDAFRPNAHSWTRLGNLLYIDARQAGFSYNLMDAANDELQRYQEFNAQNFNPFFDAADFIRVLLRFLARHDELRRNPVIVVGESYGGTRTTALLHMLLNYSDYGNGREMYQDPALRDEIQEHYDAVFPELAGTVVPPATIARQFRGQVLIQPTVSFGYQAQIARSLLRQPGSVIYKVGEEVGIPYDPAVYRDPLEFIDSVGRDYYIYTKPRGWTDGFFLNAARLLRVVDQLDRITGTNALDIDELYASARARAYRVIQSTYPQNMLAGWPAPSPDVQRLFIGPALEEYRDARAEEPGDMASYFGTLQPWDRYFLSSNGNANSAFHIYNVAQVRGYEVDYDVPRFGRMFLQNVASLPTFITNAALDLVVYTEALAPALARHDDILESVTRVKEALPGEARPGSIILTYRPDVFPGMEASRTRSIRFPLYASSCHAVSLTQPEELLADVTDWLKKNGIIPD